MNNKFQNLVVHLNEDNIQEVKELLLSKGEKICHLAFYISKLPEWNYLRRGDYDDDWYLAIKHKFDKEITLEEFKRLINEK